MGKDLIFICGIEKLDVKHYVRDIIVSVDETGEWHYHKMESTKNYAGADICLIRGLSDYIRGSRKMGRKQRNEVLTKTKYGRLPHNTADDRLQGIEIGYSPYLRKDTHLYKQPVKIQPNRVYYTLRIEFYILDGDLNIFGSHLKRLPNNQDGTQLPIDVLANIGEQNKQAVVDTLELYNLYEKVEEAGQILDQRIVGSQSKLEG